MTASLKSRLAAGETLIGTFLTLGSPQAAESLGLLGFDWLLVDLEHGGGGGGPRGRGAAAGPAARVRGRRRARARARGVRPPIARRAGARPRRRGRDVP